MSVGTPIDLDFVCEWCGKDVMLLSNLDSDMYGITVHGKKSEHIELCTQCFMTAYQALSFGKEVVQDCLTHGNGRRIYVAVEAVGDNNELVNAIVWPNQPLSESVRSAKSSSITYRSVQGLSDSPVR